MVLHYFRQKMERKMRREVGSEICVKVDFCLLKPRFISFHCLIKSNHDVNVRNIIISPSLCPHMSSRQWKGANARKSFASELLCGGAVAKWFKIDTLWWNSSPNKTFDTLECIFISYTTATLCSMLVSENTKPILLAIISITTPMNSDHKKCETLESKLF